MHSRSPKNHQPTENHIKLRRRFIIHRQYVGLPTEDLRLHHCVNVLLTNRPMNHVVEFLKAEVRLDLEVELEKIEIVFFAFIVEHTLQTAVQRHKVEQDWWACSMRRYSAKSGMVLPFCLSKAVRREPGHGLFDQIGDVCAVSRDDGLFLQALVEIDVLGLRNGVFQIVVVI